MLAGTAAQGSVCRGTWRRCQLHPACEGGCPGSVSGGSKSRRGEGETRLRHVRASWLQPKQLSSASKANFLGSAPKAWWFPLGALALILSGITPSIWGEQGGVHLTPHEHQKPPLLAHGRANPATQRAGMVLAQGRNEQLANEARGEAHRALTEVFWHWMLVLLKRRAVTRVVPPGMWKMHS